MTVRTFCRIAFVLAALLTLGWGLPAARAALTLSPLFSDGAILQRGMPVPVWGEAEPGALVTVVFGGQTRQVHAGAQGTWRVTLAPMVADSKPRALTASSGSERVEVPHVLVGDVWLCAGQSNMQSWVAGSDVSQFLKSADDPLLRVFLVDVTATPAPVARFRQGPLPGMVTIQRDRMNQYGLKWTQSTPEAARWFSAVTYAFGRQIHQKTAVPTGLITAALGGTPAQAWTPRAALLSDPVLRGLADQPRSSGLYNGTVAPLAPFAIKGVVWYQGESDADTYDEAIRYRTLLPAMIGAWRNTWGYPLPFVLVQLPAYHPIQSQPSDSPWSWLREAQAMTAQTVPQVGLAVTIDTGRADNLHPGSKTASGERAAQAALALAYHQPILPSGPLFQSMKIEGGAVRVRWANTGAGLRSQAVTTNGGATHIDAQPVQGFSVCGANHQFVWAQAQIVGKDTVVVSSPQVPHPVAVRYGWAGFPLCNLYNSDGLPAGPFRTDHFAPASP